MKKHNWKKTLKITGIVVLVCAVFSLIFLFVLKYMSDHPTVPDVKENKIIVACVGDSITYGAGVELQRDSKSYPAYLQKDLGDQYQIINYGLSGKTLTKDGDYPYTDEELYTLSLEAKADIYLIMLGTNDSKPFNWNAENYEKELKEFALSYINLENRPIVYLMKPSKCFPIRGKVAYDISDEVIHDEICVIVERVADELGINIIDLYTYTEDHSEWFGDGVHPNAEGNEAIAEYISQILTVN